MPSRSLGRNVDLEREERTHFNGDDCQPPAPTEYTRLLSHEHSTFLNPDDPAVSPYNLWTIRAIHGLSSFFLAISCIWWTFLLASMFFSFRMLYDRGSGFLCFAYATLTAAYLITTLLFFAVPSRPMNFWGILIAAFLCVDMIIILAVPRILIEEGWVGLASVSWATFIAIYNIIQTRCVEWGKRREEERLTGRPETSRSLHKWTAVLIQTALMATIGIIAVLLTCNLILRVRDTSLPAPGNRYYVQGDKFRIHLHCVGNFTRNTNYHERFPTVLIEGGEGPVEHTLEPFIHNAYQRGMIPRYCYWDRPGLAWSDNAPSPYSAGMAADTLSEALFLVDEEGPWVLVSAGIGGIYSRIFGSRHIFQVSGLLLIDTMHEDYLPMIASPGHGFLLWLQGIFSPLGVDRIIGAIFKGRTREDRVYGCSAYQTGKYIKAKLQENLFAISMTKSEIQAARQIPMSNIPLVVVSSGVEVRRSQKWAKTQEDLTRSTKNLKNWDVVENASHEVWKTPEGMELLEKRLSELLSCEIPG
ncbi:hypothetical protein BO82DRAFT_375447 [Aspergillus uvarum CBS 121591]|uniref:Uncharacterized protein n=1 Tax=Aspergillus uvarum CBS 121591 TaxID=1448315 RepID=A0A319C604_9EURO|nr:hypothetical protein BO82DRAFT_375447 [Aspergillus uvarum CBS 121591]PYH80614.1 hypothetical protein BO82DRAFT_375447 [Aspergillus uvarum CBS 121591]